MNFILSYLILLISLNNTYATTYSESDGHQSPPILNCAPAFEDEEMVETPEFGDLWKQGRSGNCFPISLINRNITLSGIEDPEYREDYLEAIRGCLESYDYDMDSGGFAFLGERLRLLLLCKTFYEEQNGRKITGFQHFRWRIDIKSGLEKCAKASDLAASATTAHGPPPKKKSDPVVVSFHNLKNQRNRLSGHSLSLLSCEALKDGNFIIKVFDPHKPGKIERHKVNNAGRVIEVDSKSKNLQLNSVMNWLVLENSTTR